MKIGIIGAGLSGLLTAIHALMHDKEHEVTLFDQRPESMGMANYRTQGPFCGLGKVHILEPDFEKLQAILRYFNIELDSLLPVTEVPIHLWSHKKNSLIPLYQGGKVNLQATGKSLIDLEDLLETPPATESLSQALGKFFKDNKGKLKENRRSLHGALNCLLGVPDVLAVPTEILKQGVDILVGKLPVRSLRLTPHFKTKIEQAIIQTGGQIVYNAEVKAENIDGSESLKLFNGGEIINQSFDQLFYCAPLHDLFYTIPKNFFAEKVIRAVDRTSPVSALVYNMVVESDLSHLMSDHLVEILFPRLNLHLEIEKVVQPEPIYNLSWHRYFHDHFSLCKKEVGQMIRDIPKALSRIYPNEESMSPIRQEKILAIPNVFARSYQKKEVRFYLRQSLVGAKSDFYVMGNGVGPDQLWSLNLFSSIFHLPQG